MRHKLNGKQMAAIKNYESVTGFEFMHLDEIDAGTMSFQEAWHNNTEWFFGVYCHVQNINLSGCGI